MNSKIHQYPNSTITASMMISEAAYWVVQRIERLVLRLGGHTKVRPHTRVKSSFPLHVLNWLAESDRQYREVVKLQSLSKERLIDMGISR